MAERHRARGSKGERKEEKRKRGRKKRERLNDIPVEQKGLDARELHMPGQLLVFSLDRGGEGRKGKVEEKLLTYNNQITFMGTFSQYRV